VINLEELLLSEPELCCFINIASSVKLYSVSVYLNTLIWPNSLANVTTPSLDYVGSYTLIAITLLLKSYTSPNIYAVTFSTLLFISSLKLINSLKQCTWQSIVLTS